MDFYRKYEKQNIKYDPDNLNFIHVCVIFFFLRILTFMFIEIFFIEFTQQSLVVGGGQSYIDFKSGEIRNVNFIFLILFFFSFEEKIK